MEEWAGYVLLASGSLCFVLAHYAHVPDELYLLPHFAGFVGLVAIVTGIAAIYVSRRDKTK
jgi:hypothetical protein